METDSTPKSAQATANEANEDDFSGLHDLKELANSARARSRRATSQGDSEIAALASTSASFKAVALTTTKSELNLPVVTPNTAALAPKGNVPAKPPLRAQGTKVDQVFATAAQAPAEPQATLVVSAAPVTSAAPAVEAVAFGAAAPVASKAPASKKTVFAVGAVALVAALGGVLWMAGGKADAPGATTPANEAQAVAQPSVVAIEAAPAAPANPEPVAVAQAPEQRIEVAAPVAKEAAPKAAVKASAQEAVAAVAPPAPAAAPKEVKSTGDKSIDDLLSDASSRTGIVDREAEVEQRKIERTELSRSDIKKAFGAVTPAASACYKQHKEAGTVAVRVTVLPTGKVAKVTAAGAFAGTPTGDCVVAAAQGATFPEWDGSQTTLSYSFLLGE